MRAPTVCLRKSEADLARTGRETRPYGLLPILRQTVDISDGMCYNTFIDKK